MTVCGKRKDHTQEGLRLGLQVASAYVWHPRGESVTLSGLLHTAWLLQPCWLISSVLTQRDEAHLAPLPKAHRATKNPESFNKLLGSHPG